MTTCAATRRRYSFTEPEAGEASQTDQASQASAQFCADAPELVLEEQGAESDEIHHRAEKEDGALAH